MNDRRTEARGLEKRDYDLNLEGKSEKALPVARVGKPYILERGVRLIPGWRQRSRIYHREITAVSRTLERRQS